METRETPRTRQRTALAVGSIRRVDTMTQWHSIQTSGQDPAPGSPDRRAGSPASPAMPGDPHAKRRYAGMPSYDQAVSTAQRRVCGGCSHERTGRSPGPSKPAISFDMTAAAGAAHRRASRQPPLKPLAGAILTTREAPPTEPDRIEPQPIGHKRAQIAFSASVPNRRKSHHRFKTSRFPGLFSTGATGLEPAASGVTGRRSNQLSYAPT
jgi:hypothetical protein